MALGRAFVRRLRRKRSEQPPIPSFRPHNREPALSTLQITPSRNLVHAEMPVRRLVSRRQEPRRDFHVGPGVHDGVEDRLAVFFEDLGVFDFAAHFPDFAAVVAEGEGAFGHELLEGVAAGGDGVAEGGAVGEVAVFGLGGCEGR